MIVLANLSNGLAYPHDGICHFQSNYAHSRKLGYCRLDSMPLDAVRALLVGETVKVVDGRRRPGLSEALRWGVPTWALAFNRAIGWRAVRVCGWETPAMRAAAHSRTHKPLVQTIRKLARVYGYAHPLTLGDTLLVECHVCEHDDNPERIAELVA